MNIQNKYLTEKVNQVQSQPVVQRKVSNQGQETFEKIFKESLARQQTGRQEDTKVTPFRGFTPGRVYQSVQQGTYNASEENSKPEVRFSKHALMRLEDRNIVLTPAQRENMVKALEKAESKGLNDSLILMDNLAFVVNVKNRTVVTAAGLDDLNENVFTNIDGAVIMPSSQ